MVDVVLYYKLRSHAAIKVIRFPLSPAKCHKNCTKRISTSKMTDQHNKIIFVIQFTSFDYFNLHCCWGLKGETRCVHEEKSNVKFFAIGAINEDRKCVNQLGTIYRQLIWKKFFNKFSFKIVLIHPKNLLDSRPISL